jgi:hypothetical protein
MHPTNRTPVGAEVMHPRDLALIELREATNSGTTELDWSGRQLGSLPDNWAGWDMLARAKRIETLNLSETDLTSIPPA